MAVAAWPRQGPLYTLPLVSSRVYDCSDARPGAQQIAGMGFGVVLPMAIERAFYSRRRAWRRLSSAHHSVSDRIPIDQRSAISGWRPSPCPYRFGSPGHCLNSASWRSRPHMKWLRTGNART